VINEYGFDASPALKSKGMDSFEVVDS